MTSRQIEMIAEKMNDEARYSVQIIDDDETKDGVILTFNGGQDIYFTLVFVCGEYRWFTEDRKIRKPGARLAENPLKLSGNVGPTAPLKARDNEE